MQRIIILAGAVAIGVGYWLPWDNLDSNHINVFDHWLFRVPLAVLALAIVVLAAVGNRRERVAGPALGTIVIAALIIGGLSGLLAYSLARTGWWGVGAGPFVTIGASLLVVILGLAGGGPERKSVGSVLSSWNREHPDGEGRQ